jgi:hypothetical protein
MGTAGDRRDRDRGDTVCLAELCRQEPRYPQAFSVRHPASLRYGDFEANAGASDAIFVKINAAIANIEGRDA